MPRNRSDRSSTYLIYVLIILLMVGALLAWQAWSRTASFEHFHRQLAATAVRGAADEVEILLAELRRSMHLFAQDRQSLFEQILRNREDESLWEDLELAVREHFPEYFGLTLTDSSGNVLRPDFDHHVEEICQQDIHGFIGRGYAQHGYIHPNPLGYHFDIMIPWGAADDPGGVFFLSFPPTMLAHILERLQKPGHTLLLLQRNRPGLIEISGGGSRDKLQRDFFLEDGELARIAYTAPVANTHWDLVDLPAQDLFAQEAARNWTHGAIVFAVFAGITLLMTHLLRRKEWHRLQAEERALRHQNDLAHVDRLNILGEMASGIAHELNQPLSAISTYCQSGLRMIKAGSENMEKLAHALEESSVQAKRAGKIIHRMQRFATKGKTHRTAIKINRVIRVAAGFIRPELDNHAIALQLDLARKLPSIKADGIQIEQVLLNLMRNAIEAMAGTANTSRRLVVSSRRAAPDLVEVRVHDTGPGLDPDSIDKVFDAFHSTKANGMGLGLAISRSIIEAHGGRLWAVPAPGTGATFCFNVPASDE